MTSNEATALRRISTQIAAIRNVSVYSVERALLVAAANKPARAIVLAKGDLSRLSK